MKIIIELDGVLCDMRPSWWQAYSDAVKAIGLARCDEETFWRLVRSGADDGQLVRGARPRQLESFRSAFNASLEADGTLALLQPDEDAARVVRGLAAAFTPVPVTLGANAAARRALLGPLGFPSDAELAVLPPGPNAVRAAALAGLVPTTEPGRPPLVIGASEAAMRAADEAGLTPVGIACGPAIGRRLEAAGARVVYPQLALFDEARRSGDSQLARLGLVAEPPRLVAAPPPRSAPTPLDRAADRIRRRQERRD